jgi:hypothetical protein
MVKKGVQMPRGSSFARPSDPIQVTQPVIAADARQCSRR